MLNTFEISLAKDAERVPMALESAKDETTRERKIAHALIALGWVDELSGTLDDLSKELAMILRLTDGL